VKTVFLASPASRTFLGER